MHDVSGDLKLLTRLSLNFCHFNEHNFKDANNANKTNNNHKVHALVIKKCRLVIQNRALENK